MEVWAGSRKGALGPKGKGHTLGLPSGFPLGKYSPSALNAANCPLSVERQGGH